MLPRSNHFSVLVERAPDNELFRFSLAQALLAEARPDEAAPQFAFCVAKKNDWMMPRILLGKIYLGAHRKDEARLLLEAALTLAVDQAHEEPEHELRALLADLR